MKKLFFIGFVFYSFFSFGQSDKEMIKSIYDSSLTEGKSYVWLDYLSNHIGGRLSGSKNAEKAVEWGKVELEKLGLDKVWLQPVIVPKWVRGEKETAFIVISGKKIKVNICALGGSVATAKSGLQAKIIEVDGMEALKLMKRSEIEGKIVFLNKPMDPTLIQTFRAYSQAVGQRVNGAAEAVKLGAVAVIVRSVNLRLDDIPHTGTMRYGDLPMEKRIPTAAISTNDAERLSKMLKKDKHLEFYFKQSCKKYDDVQSFNVIGELTGSEFPDEYIVVGGHLDSWDLGQGAQDDGAGIVQSMEVLRLFKINHIKPKRSLRVVLFMNEENGSRGGIKYAQVAKEKNENHIFALESDSGGFTPRGFSISGSDNNFRKIAGWKDLFKPYLVHHFEKGGGGADIGHLKNDTIVLAGLRVDSQRYFDYHHTSIDTFDAVNKRELELGAATMTSLIYLIDKYGFAKN